MTYETAKRLKDAGFPQDLEVGDGYFDAGARKRMSVFGEADEYGERYSPSDVYVRVPTSDELIRELGDDLVWLRRYPDNVFGKVEFFARGRERDFEQPYGEGGSTPLEALAALYIATRNGRS